MRMSLKLKIGLGLAVVFIGGVICGSVGTIHFKERAFAKFVQYETWSPAVLKGLDDELHLSAEQREKARVMLDQSTSEAIDTIRQLGVILVRLHFRVNEILTQEQRAKNSQNFEDFRQGLKDRFQIVLPPDTVTNSAPAITAKSR